MKVRKGFTLVELLVVIAILAILATASIIGFTAFTKRAQVSNDSDLVAQLNTYVLAASTNRDFKTVTEIRDELKKSGFELADLKLAAEKQDYYIGFDIKQDKFVLLKDGQGAEGYTVAEDDKVNVFVFVSTEAAAAEYGSDGQGHGYGYSLYLQNGEWSTLNVSKGVDVGENTGITSINYTNSTAQEVTIRTNGGDLIIDDSSTGTIYHYGPANSLNIIQCHTGSYHENGKVSFAEITKGRIVLEAESDVTQIHVNKKENEEEFDDIIISYDTRVDFEKVDLTRDEIEIATNGTLVVAIQAGTEESAEKDYVWLTKQGVYEQITVSDNKESAGTTWVDTSNKSGQTKEAAKKIANNIGRNASTQEIEETVTVAEVSYALSIDPNTRELILTNTENNQVVTDERINEAVASGIENRTVYESSIAAVETEMFEEANEENENFDNFVARIGLVGYESFSDALSAAENGNTIILLKDISITTSTSLSKSITLNLNGHKITSSATLFNMYSSDVIFTIKDSSTEKTGEIDVTAGKAIYVSSGYLKIESGNIVVQSGSSYTYGVQVGSSGTFEMTGGSITIPNTSTSTYNYCVNNSGVTTISGGSFVAKASGGNYTISSTSGTLTISGGNFEAYAYPAGFKSPYVLYGSGNKYVSCGFFRTIGDQNTYSAGYLVDGSNNHISGGYFGGVYFYSIDGDNIAAGFMVITNTDPETKTNYKFVVVKETE